MAYNTPVSSSGIRRPRITPEPTVFNNVCHNSESSLLSSAGSTKIWETGRPDMADESVHVCGTMEEKQPCLKIVTFSLVGQTCHQIPHNLAFENLEFSNHGLAQQHGTSPKYRTASLDNFTAKTETLINEIQHVPFFHDSHKHKHNDKPVKSGFIPDFWNFSWTIRKFLLVLLLLVDMSSAIRDKELSVTDISSVRHSPCLLHFSATTLVYTRHPDNCSIFYICYAFKQWEMICSQANTVFSLRHRVCVWKNSNLDDCQDSTVANEDDYFTNPTFANDIEDMNNKQFQFSINKEIDTTLDSQYAILTQQPLKTQNWEIRGTEILKDKMADLYEAPKKNETKVLQKPTQEEMKQKYFKSGLQTKHKPESWYTFLVSHPQTLDTSVYGLPVKSSTIDFIKKDQSLETFHDIRTTKPFHLEKVYTVADGNIFVDGNDTVIGGEDTLSDNDNGVLEDTRDVMSGEIKQAHLDEITDVLSSEIEDILSTEMVDVLPGEIKGVSSGQIENALPGEIRDVTPDDINLVLPGEVNNELPSYKIDYYRDKTDFSSLVGAENEQGGEVAIEDIKENISHEDRTNDIVHVSSDVNTDISDLDFMPQDLVSKSENVDKNTDSMETGEATKLDEDTIFLTTKDRKKSYIKSSVTDSATEQTKIQQFQLPLGQFLDVDDNNLTLAVQHVGTEIIPLLDRTLINEIGLSLPDHRERNHFNESTNVKSGSERGSNTRPGFDLYKPGQSWLNLPKAQHVDFNTVEDRRRELDDNNYVTNKQTLIDNQNVKHESVPFRDVRISSFSEYFQNTAIPNWNKLWNSKLDIHKANFQMGNTESKLQPHLTTKQNSGQEYARNVYENYNNSKFVATYNRSQKYGKLKYHELKTAITSTESTPVVRPWQGLSDKLRIPSTKYKLFNGLNIKEIDQEKYGDSSLLKKFAWPWQSVNMYNKIPKLNGSGITIKKQIKSIREKVHKIADKISNIFWLNPQSTTPSLKNHTYVKMVNHSKMSPKQGTGETNSHKSPMWFLKSRYINTPLPRHTHKSETPQQNKDRRRSYVLKRSRKHKNKNRRMRIIPTQKDNTKMSKRLQIKKTRKQNKNLQQKVKLRQRSRNSNTFKFIPGRHDKNEQRDVEFVADRSNTDSKDVKFISSRSNFKDAKEVRSIPGRNYNKRENVNFGNGKQLDGFDGNGLNPDHIQNRIMARYYHTYLQQKLDRLLQQLKQPSLSNERNNGRLNETKQSLQRNHTTHKVDTHTKRPSKQTVPKIFSPKKLTKSSIKLGPRKNPQYIFSRMQLPQLGIKPGQDTKLGHLYSEIDVNSQNINEKKVSDWLIWKIGKSDKERTKKYSHSKQENTRNKTEPEKNALDDLYLGNIIDGSVTKTDNTEHGRHTLVKTRNKSKLRLEDLKIDYLPKIFLDTKLDLPDWETSRRFSYKIRSRPKMPLPGETTTSITMPVYPPSTNQPSPPPTTTTTTPTTMLVYPPSTNQPSPPPTTTTTTTPTTARMVVFPTNVPHLSTINSTTTAYRPSTQPSVTEDIPEYRKELQDRCGVMATPLIIGGRKSRAGQWPWQVSLQIVTSTTPWHRCGGVLVHARWVLTAAHCVEGSFYGDIVNWRVVMADYDLESVSGNEIYRSIKRVISHPEYVRSSNFPNDVALLELDSPVDLTSGDVQTACLPDADFPLTPGTKCWISGWGETRGSGGKENVMNEVPVDVMSHDQCKPMWGRVDIDVLDSQVCLGYGDTGACYGDSGGPLMCEREGRFYVAGVMSWLINNCSANNFPNVFTRLPNYMDWLYKELDYFEWFRHL